MTPLPDPGCRGDVCRNSGDYRYHASKLGMVMTDRKKPGVAFWITVPLIAMLAYIGSIGPATWIEARIEARLWKEGDWQDWAEDLPSILDKAYRPVLWTAYRCPDFLQNALRWYLSIGLPPGEDAMFDEGSIMRGTVL
jgi:hypothetical protein